MHTKIFKLLLQFHPHGNIADYSDQNQLIIFIAKTMGINFTPQYRIVFADNLQLITVDIWIAPAFYKLLQSFSQLTIKTFI